MNDQKLTTRQVMRGRRISLAEAAPEFRQRRGVVTLWFILAFPVFLILMALILDVANLWVARIELKNAMDATALAAVQQWSEFSGDTRPARIVGRTYAAANTVSGEPVVIDLNYDNSDPTNNPNQNLSCDGNLLFGALVELDGDGATCDFSTCATAACGTALVWFDVTGQGNLGGQPGMSQDHQWGVSFQPIATTPTTLRIESIIYRLPEIGETPDGTDLNFHFQNSLPRVSPNTSDAVSDSCPNGQGGSSSQPDLSGLVVDQVEFFIDVPDLCDATSGTTLDGADPNQLYHSKTLGLSFTDFGGDDGFAPRDRLRFGAQVHNHINNAQTGADEIGEYEVEVTVFFRDIAPGGGSFCISGNFIDTVDRKTSQGPNNPGCAQCATLSSWGSLILTSGMMSLNQ